MENLEKKLERVKEIDKEMITFLRVSHVLYWDKNVNLKSAGSQERAMQIGLMQSKIHELKTSVEFEGLINDLCNSVDKLSKVDKKLVLDFKKAIDREKKLPKELVQKKAEITSSAHGKWISARKNENFKEFLPELESIFDILMKESDLIGYEDSPYDVHLYDLREDMTSKEIDKLFKPLEEGSVEMLKTLSVKHKDVDTSFLHQHFDRQKELELSNFIAGELNYDFDRGMGVSEVFHPFSYPLGFDDSRFTTKFDTTFFNFFFFATMHEVGHSLYEQGLPADLKYSSVGRFISGGVHESQSKFHEKMIGKSRPFLKRYFPVIRSFFPSQFKGVSDEQFYNAINKVEPSYVRVMADEVTYPLHIVLRYNVEKALFSGKVKMKDADDFWRAEFKRIFGIEITKPSQGILQDVHWSSGGFGSFPAYAFGSLYYGQFYQVMRKEVDVLKCIENGDLKPVLAWLRKHIHQKASTITTKELIKEISGQELDAKFYLDYIKEKFL